MFAPFFIAPPMFTFLATSVSTQEYPRQEVRRMGCWLQKKLDAVGVDARLVELPDDPITKLPLPPLVTGCLGTDTSRKTVLVYGHYDIQPVRVFDNTYVV